MTVSVATFICILISAILTIGLPVALLLYVLKKYKASAVPFLVGAAAFILFVLVLEGLVHRIVLQPDASGQIALRSKPFLYMLYGGLMAGLFEETARFFAFSLLKKKYTGIGNALSYGIGHGGIESILLVGLVMINNLVYAVMLNTGTMETLKSTMPAATAAQLDAAAQALTTTAPGMFLVGGLERIFAITVHIGLSVLVYYAVVRRDKWWLYPAAIVLHAVVDFPAALMQAGVLQSFVLVEILTALSAILIALLAVVTHRKLKERDSVVPQADQVSAAKPGTI